jgi:hypothetical protein
MIRYNLANGNYQRSFGIALLLDPFSEQAVRSIWAGLEQEGITASLPQIVCALPHLTLCICRDIDSSGLAQALSRYAAWLQPLQIAFTAVGAFPAALGAAVFLQPTITERLLDAHRQFTARLQPFLQEISPYYLPGNWTPHCSLGIGLPETVARQTIDYCLSLELPLRGQVQGIALLEMLTHRRQVVAGCERLRFSLGDGKALPVNACPRPQDCPFIAE